MNDVMIFEEYEVEVFEINGKVLFNPYHVGECLELKESAVRMAILKMNEKQVVKLTNSGVKFFDIRKLNNSGENFLTESGVYKLVFKSNKPNAEKFVDWVTDEVLPNLRKTGSYSIKEQVAVSFKEQVECIKIIAEDLHVNEVSKLVMYQKLCESNHVSTDFLPDYTAGGNRETKSATELLKQFNYPLSVAKFNQLLMKEGILEERERTSSIGKKKFKALTEKGLQYGENLVSKYNTKETQPYYYVDTFPELYNLATRKMEVVQ